MKKILFATTALAALAITGAAQAADPIKLQLGGYSKWVVAFAEQDGDFESSLTTTTPAGVSPAGVPFAAVTTSTPGNFTRFDVQGDNEIFFKGSTALDNGIKIGIDVQLEAGGGDVADYIDESYITVDGVFGRVILGTENNGAYLLHVSAPDAAGLLEEQTVGNATFGLVQAPTGFAGMTTTAIVSDNDAEKITYVAPSFAGFTVGASYVPDAGGQDCRTVTNNNSTAAQGCNPTLGGFQSGNVPASVNSFSLNEAYGAGAAYNNTFGGFGVKASVGYVHADVLGGDDHNEYSAGAQLSFAGFTLGGGYRLIDSDLGAAGGTTGLEGQAWTVGLSYAAGPFAISAAYFTSEITDRVTVGGEDEYNHYQLSAKYTMGPGVDAIAAVGYMDFDAAAAAVVDNHGMFALTGISLAF